MPLPVQRLAHHGPTDHEVPTQDGLGGKFAADGVLPPFDGIAQVRKDGVHRTDTLKLSGCPAV